MQFINSPWKWKVKCEKPIWWPFLVPTDFKWTLVPKRYSGQFLRPSVRNGPNSGLELMSPELKDQLAHIILFLWCQIKCLLSLIAILIKLYFHRIVSSSRRIRIRIKTSPKKRPKNTPVSGLFWVFIQYNTCIFWFWRNLSISARTRFLWKNATFFDSKSMFTSLIALDFSWYSWNKYALKKFTSKGLNVHARTQ